MIAIENSDVFIYVGGENDVWVEDILSSMPDKDRVSIRLLDCVETEEEEHVEGMKEPAGDSHHEMHGEEEHEGSVHEIDEHVWTSPVNASVIVEKIKEVLIQKDSENKAAYEENADRYQTELAQLDKRFSRSCETVKKKFINNSENRFPVFFILQKSMDWNIMRHSGYAQVIQSRARRQWYF
mgnify:CR=1 FL=1